MLIMVMEKEALTGRTVSLTSSIYVVNASHLSSAVDVSQCLGRWYTHLKWLSNRGRIQTRINVDGKNNGPLGVP